MDELGDGETIDAPAALRRARSKKPDDLDLGATITGFQPEQKLFGRYTLIRQLGRGGMGVVWLARDGTLGRDIALKFLPEVVAGDRVAIEGLKREVRRAIGLGHPHIVKVHDFVTDGRTAAVSMEYVAGDTLNSLRLDEPGQVFTAEKLAPWVEQLCGALDYAHRKGRIVHRDLKPGNLMIDAEGDLKVLDFGLAAKLAESVSQVSRQSSGSGTPAYMSPQQLRGVDDPELSDDLYALGATLYDLLAGQPPFRSTQTSALVHQVLNEQPRSLNQRRAKAGQPAVPPEWEETIMALLAKEPADRPQSAGEVAERLRLASSTSAPRPQSIRAVNKGLGSAGGIGKLHPTPVRQSNRAGLPQLVTPVVDDPNRSKTQPKLDAAIRGNYSEPALKDGMAMGKGRSWLHKLSLLMFWAGGPLMLIATFRVDKMGPADQSSVYPFLMSGWGFVILFMILTAVQETHHSNSKHGSKDTSNTNGNRLVYGILAAGIVLIGLGYYILSYLPKQRDLEMARLEAQRQVEYRRLEQQRAEAARLAAARGGLIVRTEPGGAEVIVGGVGIEKSPATFKELRLGQYEVTVRKQGYEDQVLKLTVEENRFVEPPLVLLKPLVGRVALITEPAGLDFELSSTRLVADDGHGPVTRSGKTPADLPGLPIGSYRVAFRRAGWPVQTRAVEISLKQTVSATADFVPGSLLVESTPAGAEVLIDGKVAGRTPLRLLQVMPGEVGVELKLYGYKSGHMRGTIETRQELRLSAALEKIPGPEEGQAFTIPGLSLTILPIASGTFLMGSATGGDDDERPVTQVTLTKSFWLGRTEVTQAQWAAVMGSNPSHFKGTNLPVDSVSWNDAMEFCRKLTERERSAGRLPEGYTYTLPTEAQWEYACRAGTTGDYAGILRMMGWYTDNRRGGTKPEGTEPVGNKWPNDWSLHNMHGNVWEWCADWYGNYPGGDVIDPTGTASGSQRVNRGGAWFNAEGHCRSATRGKIEPGFRGQGHGFRLALAPTSR